MLLEPIGHHLVMELLIPSMPGRVILFFALLLTEDRPTGDLSKPQSMEGSKRYLADQTPFPSFLHPPPLGEDDEENRLQLSTEKRVIHKERKNPPNPLQKKEISYD
jgi:hypothetical protein